ncbi:MAG TPA: hypothetical protein QGH10_03725 [Armatimonadota bacterium]|jgi:alpha-galactosidase/6-phospho-beta-glucosidase family protein|nr:hypothetical protein [Armatimonadota bacterium]
MVDKGRTSACHVGQIPPQLAALDPHTSSWLTLPEIKSMFDEMVDAQKDSLAAYLG